MKCLDKKLTREQVFERIDRYYRQELTPKQEANFEKHFLKCDSCYNKLLLHQLTLQVVKEYGDEIFHEVKEKLKESEQIVTLWLMLNNAIMKEIKLRPGIPWSVELLEAGLYALIYLIGRKKKVLWQKRIVPSQQKGGFMRGRLYSPSQVEIEEIQIPTEKGTPKKEVNIIVEPKKNHVILSLAIKKT